MSISTTEGALTLNV